MLTATGEDLAELIRPARVQHLVSLVDDHVTQAAKSEHIGTLDEVNETTGRGDQNVATLGELANLLCDRTATICNAGAQHGAVAELASLIEDLDRQLTCRADDNDKRLGADLCLEVLDRGRVRTSRGELLCLTHELVQNGNQIGGSLARS